MPRGFGVALDELGRVAEHVDVGRHPNGVRVGVLVVGALDVTRRHGAADSCAL